LTIIDYIYAKKDDLHELLLLLHNFINEYDDIRADLKWGIPFYSVNKPICYINPLKSKGVEVVFWNGINLKGSLSYLDQKKRKQMDGITYENIASVDFEVLHSILQEARHLDHRYK
jgi:hypothetical protein